VPRNMALWGLLCSTMLRRPTFPTFRGQ
jgi:hypothetical protein